MTNENLPPITLEWAEAQEKHHLRLAAFHHGKASSFAALRQAIVEVSEPERPSENHWDLPGDAPEPAAIAATPTGTKKWNCLDIIARTDGITTPEIVVQLQKRGFSGSNQPNTSPQLSLYKTDGLISLDGSLWRITRAGHDFISAEKN